MRRNTYGRAAMLVAVLFVIFSCASRQHQVEAAAGQGEKTLAMNASSYKFEPNNIKANQGDTIVLNITNVSDKQHNFTIKDPGGKIIQSVELLPKKTVPVKISFPEKGSYDFYCNKPFHPTLGMKGSIQVGPSK